MTKAKINLFSAEYKATKKLGGSLTIFAVLTARTLYTYKYEVAINNDKLHSSASVFYPQNLRWSVILCQVGRAPVRVAPVGLAGHLSGFPSGMFTCPAIRRTPCGHRVSSVPAGAEDTRLCGRRAGIWPGWAWRAPFSDLNLRLLFRLLVFRLA